MVSVFRVMRHSPAVPVLALLLLTLAVFSIAGCSSSLFGSSNQNQYIDATRAKYFQGQYGVEMAFDQFPDRLFYFESAGTSAVNDFPFSVAVRDVGASYSRGAIFVSGYDPHMIQIDEIKVASVTRGACSLRIGDYSLNKIGMFMSCGDNFAWSGNENNWLQSIKVRGKQWFGDSILSKLSVGFSRFQDGTNRVDITYDNYTFPFAMREHGIMLIGILAGIDFTAFYGQEFLLAGNTYDYPGGEQDYISYHGHIVNWPQGADEVPQHFLATSCYMYTTFASPVVCIDPAPYSTNRKVCSPFMASWSSGQGAPVAVTSVQQENTPRTSVFHVTIKNVGAGTVFDPGALEKCSPYYPGGAKSADQNVVWLGEVRIGNTVITDRCTPQGLVRLQNGQGSFSCVYPIEYAELNSAYETPLIIELWYGYSKTIEKAITVKQVT
jgi:hypothetical protein